MGNINIHKQTMLEAGLPSKAIDRLEQYINESIEDVKDLKVQADPNDKDKFAIRVTVETHVSFRLNSQDQTIKYTEDIDMIWHQHTEDFYDTEFATWPPTD